MNPLLAGKAPERSLISHQETIEYSSGAHFVGLRMVTERKPCASFTARIDIEENFSSNSSLSSGTIRTRNILVIAIMLRAFRI